RPTACRATVFGPSTVDVRQVGSPYRPYRGRRLPQPSTRSPLAARHSRKYRARPGSDAPLARQRLPTPPLGGKAHRCSIVGSARTRAASAFVDRSVAKGTPARVTPAKICFPRQDWAVRKVLTQETDLGRVVLQGGF